MNQRPFSGGRKGLYYTGLGLAVGGIVAIAVMTAMVDPLSLGGAAAVLFMLPAGITLLALVKPPIRLMHRRSRAIWPWLVAALLAGTVAALSYGVWNLIEGYSSLSWPQSEGDIVSSKIEEHSGKHGLVYTPEIAYHYEVDGAGYSADRIAFPGPFSKGTNAAQAIMDRYPRGRRIPVFYSPGHPGRAVLEPGVDSDTWIPVVVGIFALGLTLVLLSEPGRRVFGVFDGFEDFD